MQYGSAVLSTSPPLLLCNMEVRYNHLLIVTLHVYSQLPYAMCRSMQGGNVTWPIAEVRPWYHGSAKAGGVLMVLPCRAVLQEASMYLSFYFAHPFRLARRVYAACVMYS